MTTIHNVFGLLDIPENEKSTDRFDVYPTGEPAWVAIDIHEPVVGGDTSGLGSSGNGSDNRGGGDAGINALKHIANDVASGAVAGFENVKGWALGDDSGSGMSTKNPHGGSIFENRKVATRLSSSIQLPMPESLEVPDSATWGMDNDYLSDLAVAGAAQLPKLFGGGGGNVVGTILNAISAQSAVSGFSKMAKTKYGIAISPRKEMYYEGPEFRDFSFNWKILPRTAADSEAIFAMYQTLRQHLYPERLSDTLNKIGFEVWKLPSTYQVKFMYGANENKFIPKIKPCVATSISTNMTEEGGWKGFIDGAPLSIAISINLREIEPLTQKDIKEGY